MKDIQAMGVFEGNLFSFAPSKEEALLPSELNKSNIFVDFSPLLPLGIMYTLLIFNKADILIISALLTLTAVMWFFTWRNMFKVKLKKANGEQVTCKWPVNNLVVITHPTPLSEHVLDMARRGITLNEEQISLIKKVEHSTAAEYEDELQQQIFSR